MWSPAKACPRISSARGRYAVLLPLHQVLDPPLVAWAAVGIALAGYLHYVFSVIDQICAYLGINCLTIPVHSSEMEEKQN